MIERYWNMKASDIYRFLEKKDHLIDNLNGLTPDQKEELKAFFAKHPSYESRVDWNNKSLSYKDFESLLALDGKSKTQAKKNGLSGLVEGKDYFDFGEANVLVLGRCHLYQPLSYLGSKILASNAVPPVKGNGAKWCISYQKTNEYWFKYTDKKIKFLFVFTKDTKYALTIYSKDINIDNEVYTFEDTNIHWPNWCRSTSIKNCISNLKEIPKPSLDELLKRYKGILVKNPDGTVDKVNQDYINLRPFVDDTGHFICQFGKWNDYFDANGLGLVSLVGSPKEVKYGFSCFNNRLTSLHGVTDIIPGDFNCSSNELTSLEDGPKSVGLSYHCHDNQLVSLKGCPTKVGGTFDCSNNKLTSLEYGPESVYKTFNCSGNQLMSLKHGPSSIGRSYDCGDNQLTSLDGAPEEIPLDFGCDRNNLTSLEGGPRFVSGDYDCSNDRLKSLTGAPKNYVGGFYCNKNELKSLVGAPKIVQNIFNCSNNPIESVDGLPGKMYRIYCDKNLADAIQQKSMQSTYNVLSIV